ncbi:MAG: winged helix-turn-helix transcriptional regulator, partial [Coprobacillus cateniformis]
MKKQYDIDCNIAQTLNLIGDKWTLLILHAVKVGFKTYKELQENLPGIPTNLLSNRLKTLCEDDLLDCELYSKHPPRYQYNLTDKSNDLDDIYNALI